ncbi:MAG: A/G-specific adenine glycosylase [Phycisphaerales bacterium]|jgi:A/G-specific adenine glycosylase
MPPPRQPVKPKTVRPKPVKPGSICRALEPWFLAAARPFPWRPLPIGHPHTARDPWASLVSELMLQQTQAARVAERFEGFLRRFPTPAAMASADEAEVLAAWSGLGFYRRARLLHAAARAIVEQHGGEVPREPKALLALPGVGRYTAGAIASMVFDQPEPIVDGNVSRVLLRVHGRDGAAGESQTDRWVWERAHELVESAESPAVLNEALMELGATVCTPKAARCEDCPLRALCVANREERVSEIPRPKKRARVIPVWAAMVVHVDRRGRILLEQRPSTGMWSNMWQTPTLERADREPTAEEVLGFARADSVECVEEFTHQTSHREVRFSVWKAKGMRAGRAGRADRVRARANELSKGDGTSGGFSLSNPQRGMILRALEGRLP